MQSDKNAAGNMKTFFFLGFFWFFPSVIFSELLIMTYQCSFPVFFELQCKALKAFCEDEYTEKS